FKTPRAAARLAAIRLLYLIDGTSPSDPFYAAGTSDDPTRCSSKKFAKKPPVAHSRCATAWPFCLAEIDRPPGPRCARGRPGHLSLGVGGWTDEDPSSLVSPGGNGGRPRRAQQHTADSSRGITCKRGDFAVAGAPIPLGEREQLSPEVGMRHGRPQSLLCLMGGLLPRARPRETCSEPPERLRYV